MITRRHFLGAAAAVVAAQPMLPRFSQAADRSPLWDCHMHIIDPRFPLVANQGYLPDPFPLADYRRLATPLGVRGGAVVSASFQGFDQSYLLDTLAALGPGWVGVTQLPATVSDGEIRDLAAKGVRAVRFTLFRGADVREVEPWAAGSGMWLGCIPNSISTPAPSRSWSPS
jgi:predicted TIM-barrel fold metal-dependent hydrolase